MNNDKDLKIAEEIRIFQGSGRDKVVGEGQSLELSRPWGFALGGGRA